MSFKMKKSPLHKDPPGAVSGYNLGYKALKFGLDKLAMPVKRQLAKNLDTYNYSKKGLKNKKVVNIGPAERVAKALFSKEDRMASHQGQATRERQDLLNVMMTGKQEHNSLPMSTYKPSSSKNANAKYYSSPTTEKTLKEKIKNPEFFNKFKKNKSGIPTYVDYLSDSDYGTGKNVLGNYTMSLGEDEKGKYVSYYDKWDLSPYKGKSKTLDFISSVGQDLIGVNPAEVYGRVYYD